MTFHLGHVISASITEMKITVVPTQAGTITNLATVRLNGPEVTTEDNSATVITEIEGSLEPTLTLLTMKNGSFQVFATGSPGHRYVLETSADLVNWSPLVLSAIPPARFNSSIPRGIFNGDFTAS